MASISTLHVRKQASVLAAPPIGLNTWAHGQCQRCKMMLAITGSARTTAAVERQALRIPPEPFLTHNPMPRTSRPMGRSTTQHSITPRGTAPDQSPQGGGKAVAQAINTPQAMAGAASTRVSIWTTMATGFGCRARGDSDAGCELSVLSTAKS